jgi:hypothetical protein
VWHIVKYERAAIAWGLLGVQVSIPLHAAMPLACDGRHKEDESRYGTTAGLIYDSQFQALAEDVRDGLALPATTLMQGGTRHLHQPKITTQNPRPPPPRTMILVVPSII